MLEGVTTNPSLFAKVGGSYDDILKQICEITRGPVSAEVVAEDVEGMLREGRHFATLAPNIVVKVPMSEQGLEAIARFAHEGIKTNCTLIFSSMARPERVVQVLRELAGGGGFDAEVDTTVAQCLGDLCKGGRFEDWKRFDLLLDFWRSLHRGRSGVLN